MQTGETQQATPSTLGGTRTGAARPGHTGPRVHFPGLLPASAPLRPPDHGSRRHPARHQLGAGMQPLQGGRMDRVHRVQPAERGHPPRATRSTTFAAGALLSL